MIATQMLMFLLCENLTEEFTTKLKYRSIIFCYERNSPLVNAFHALPVLSVRNDS